MTETTLRIQMRDWVGDLGALDPSMATRLAEYVIGRRPVVPKIILDFRDAGTVSSAFANELFVRLNEVQPLSEWQDVLEFAGLATGQAQVITRSLQAVRNLTRQNR